MIKKLEKQTDEKMSKISNEHQSALGQEKESWSHCIDLFNSPSITWLTSYFVALHQIIRKKHDEAMNNMHEDKAFCLLEEHHQQLMLEDKRHAQEIALIIANHAKQIKLMEREHYKTISELHKQLEV